MVDFVRKPTEQNRTTGQIESAPTQVSPPECIVCGGSSIALINSYKHVWLSCNDCGNISRKRKEKYFVPRVLPKGIMNKVLPLHAINLLYPEESVIEEESSFYDYYKDTSEQNVSETKWNDHAIGVMENLERHGVSLKGKKVLDISGGPGFDGVEYSKVAQKMVVTEFSEKAVGGMKRNLGINAVKFDYQNDRIDEILDDKFDVVFINWSINFCTNIKSFIGDLRNILNIDSIVYVTFVAPTLGTCLRWQHDEYTYNVLYHPDTMLRVFSEEGFTSLQTRSYSKYGYMDNIRLKMLLFRLPYTIRYTLSSLRPLLSINRELVCKSFLHIYKVNQTHVLGKDTPHLQTTHGKRANEGVAEVQNRKQPLQVTP